jgi:hypothetical protein
MSHIYSVRFALPSMCDFVNICVYLSSSAGFLQGLSSLLQPSGQLVFMDSAASEFDIEVAAELYKPATLLTKSYHLGKYDFLLFQSWLRFLSYFKEGKVNTYF